jgi:Undecaprenyl-phosphate glucose phosphotransferase
MIDHLRRYSLVLRIIIIALPVVSFSLAGNILVHWIGHKPGFLSPNYLYLALFTTMVWAIVAEWQEVTSITKVTVENTGLRASFSAWGITSVIEIVTLFFVHEPFYSRLFLVLSALILLCLAVSVRTLFRIMIRQLAGRRPPVKVIIVGVSRFAARAAVRLLRDEFVHCQIVGYIRMPGEEIRVSNAPVLELTDMEAIEKLNADDILIAVSPDLYSDLRRCIAKLEVLGMPIRIIVNSGNGMKVRSRVFELGRLQMLDLDPGPTSSVGYFLVKRAFDLVFTVSVLALFAVPMLIIAIAIKLTSRGPVLFKQQRVGKFGKLFTMYKFRTMRVSSTAEGDTGWTAESDPRRTWVGAFLRAASLDELPQFFNVLKGEMSVVGPRPERLHFVRKFRTDITFYQTRHHLNVGITGWAQVNGLRGDTSIQRRVRYDLYYLQHWSLLFDIKIILMTLFGGFMGKNAY